MLLMMLMRERIAAGRRSSHDLGVEKRQIVGRVATTTSQIRIGRFGTQARSRLRAFLIARLKGGERGVGKNGVRGKRYKGMETGPGRAIGEGRVE